VRVRVLDVDVEKERISLGIKQLTADPFEASIGTVRKGEVVTCTITQVQENGIEVEITEGVHGFIRKVELARDRADQRTERFAVGDKIDAKVTQIDKGSRRVSLSVKAREMEEEKAAMAEFGSSDSGASLGDILGAAMRQARQKEDVTK
jgi:small subunit ribosomal protein S1